MLDDVLAGSLFSPYVDYVVPVVLGVLKALVRLFLHLSVEEVVAFFPEGFSKYLLVVKFLI